MFCFLFQGWKEIWIWSFRAGEIFCWHLWVKIIKLSAWNVHTNSENCSKLSWSAFWSISEKKEKEYFIYTCKHIHRFHRNFLVLLVLWKKPSSWSLARQRLSMWTRKMLSVQYRNTTAENWMVNWLYRSWWIFSRLNHRGWLNILWYQRSLPDFFFLSYHKLAVDFYFSTVNLWKSI